MGKAKSIRKRVGSLHASSAPAARVPRRRSSRSTSSRPRTRPRRCSPSRTSSSRTAALQHPAARRQSYPYIGISLDSGFRVSTSRASATAPSAPTSAFLERKRVRETLDLLGKLFPYRTCDGRSRGAPREPLPRLLHRALPGACVDYIGEEDYRANIDAIVSFLSGRYREIERELEERMEEAAERRSSRRRPPSATACARCGRCSSASAWPTRGSARST